MNPRTIAFVAAMGIAASAWAAPDDGMVACWTFDEGSGAILHDSSGHRNDGKIHGAEWVASGKGHALKFDGEKDFVDCGAGASLDITGPITLQAWVMPTAPNRGEPMIVGKFFESYAISYYGSAYFYISSGGNPCAGPIKIGQWNHVLAMFDGTILKIYINGEQASAATSKFKEVKRGQRFLIGCTAGDATAADPYLRATAFFPGLIDGVRVHNRALTEAEVLHYYGLEAADKGLPPFDVGLLGRVTVEPFFYPELGKAVLSANFRYLDPLPKDAQAFAELAVAGDEAALQSVKIAPDSRYEAEGEFAIGDLKPGKYEMRAVVRGGAGGPKPEKVEFTLPLTKAAQVPAPAGKSVSSLPPVVTPPEYKPEIKGGGGFTVSFNERTFRVESVYSYPDGGENRLAAGDLDSGGEKDWRVAPGDDSSDPRVRQLTAGGRYYTISRRITLEKSRILVKDTIKNTTGEILGVMLSNRINVAGDKDVKVTQMANPTMFVAKPGCGLGLVALDDLYQCQGHNAYSDGMVEIRDDHFGLDKGASYTLEWAVYPTATEDYYDFINQLRKDEGINRRVDGAFAFVPRRDPPSPQSVELKNIKYASIGCLGQPLDDVYTPLEGFEFMEYPKECAALKATMGRTKAMYPGMKVMFHVAHSLYACGNPKERFPDSLALLEDGKQVMYGPDSWDDYYKNSSFSREKFDNNWRWWIFYPTMENSFGKAMIQAMQYMVDELGATGMWADGYTMGYVPGDYSFDKFDGHSVTIDPKTKRVTRTKTCVPYVTIPVLKKVAQIIAAKGGHTITNGDPGSRALWNEDIITSCETGGGDATPVSGLHVGRSVTPLGNPGAVRNGRDVYRDIIAKLDYGALYFWYGDGDRLKYKTLVEHMYPITFESIHSGTVVGKERIITRKSGIYGWRDGDKSLHVVYLYDARGHLSGGEFLTTIDASGMRTELVLGKDQSAAIVKSPITFEAAGPVNVVVRQYDRQAIRLGLNGKGSAKVHVKDGPFPLYPALMYRVQAGDKAQTIGEYRDDLSFTVEFDGPTEVVVTRGDRPS